MSAYDIAPGVPAALERFVLPDKLGFGAVNAPVMFSAEWRDGQWQRGTLLPYGPIEVWPGSRALQYAELIFEGLKAYKVGQPRPNLFRAADNCRRMERPAKRLSMPLLPVTLFFQGIEAVTRACAPFIPGRSGHSLYLRPFLYGTESGYMLRNSHSFRFMVIANPVESYATGAPTVAIERSEVRAARGGIGAAKAAANYAASLRASSGARARPHGCAVARCGRASLHPGALRDELLRRDRRRAAYARARRRHSPRHHTRFAPHACPARGLRRARAPDADRRAP